MPGRQERLSRADGFTLLELLVACGLLVTAVAAVAQLFTLSIDATLQSRSATRAATLASRKLEELAALAWGYDATGRPLTDTSTDTTTDPESQGGRGLSPSGGSLDHDTPGFVDHVDARGHKSAAADRSSGGTAFVRRWSIAPAPWSAADALVIQVLVMPIRTVGHSRSPDVRAPDDAWVSAVRARRAP